MPGFSVHRRCRSYHRWAFPFNCLAKLRWAFQLPYKTAPSFCDANDCHRSRCYSNLYSPIALPSNSIHCPCFSKPRFSLASLNISTPPHIVVSPCRRFSMQFQCIPLQICCDSAERCTFLVLRRSIQRSSAANHSAPTLLLHMAPRDYANALRLSSVALLIFASHCFAFAPHRDVSP